MPTCWPDSDSIWAQPAPRKSAVRPGSRSSLTPTTSASSSGPARPPAFESPPSIAERTLNLTRSSGGAGSRRRTPPCRAKAIRPESAEPQPAAAPDRGANPSGAPSTSTRTISPRTMPAAPRTKTVKRPLAPASAPSRSKAASASSSKAVMPDEVLRGSDATRPRYAAAAAGEAKPGDHLPARASAWPWIAAPSSRPKAADVETRLVRAPRPAVSPVPEPEPRRRSRATARDSVADTATANEAIASEAAIATHLDEAPGGR